MYKVKLKLKTNLCTASAAGEKLHTDKDLKRFIQNVDAKFFVEKVNTMLDMGKGRKELELMWGPVIEGEMTDSVGNLSRYFVINENFLSEIGKYSKKPFIRTNPEDILNNDFNHKIDVMFGICADVNNFI